MLLNWAYRIVYVIMDGCLCHTIYLQSSSLPKFKIMTKFSPILKIFLTILLNYFPILLAS